MATPIDNLPSRIILRNILPTKKTKKSSSSSTAPSEQLGPTIEKAKFYEAERQKVKVVKSGGGSKSSRLTSRSNAKTPLGSPEALSTVSSSRTVSNLPGNIPTQSLATKENIIGRLEKERYGPGGIYANPFFSTEGQKERFSNAARTLGAAVNPFDKTGVKVSRDVVGNEKVAKVIDYAASNPFTTAAAATGVVGAGRAAAPFVTRLGAKAAATQVGQSFTGGLNVAKQTWLGRLGLGFGITTVKGAAIVKGSEVVSTFTASKEQRQLMQNPKFSGLYRKGIEAERQAIEQEGGLPIPFTDRNIGLGSLGFGLSTAISSKKKVFREKVKSEALALGLDPDLAVKTAERQRASKEWGEGLALLEISRSAESIGRTEVAKAFAKKGTQQVPTKQIFGKVFRTTFFPIAGAGVVEGGAAEITQQIAREEPFDKKKVAVMAGVGGLTAGVLGGTIAGLKANRPGASVALETVASIADPFEKPGDLLQDLVERGARKSGVNIPRAPVFTIAPTEAITISQAPASKGPRSKTSFANFVNSFIGSSTTPTAAPTQSLPIGPNIPKPKGGPTSPFIFSPTTQTPTTTPTTETTPSNIWSPEPSTQTSTTTSTPTTNINVNIPVVTPQLRVPPPIPIALPAGGGSGGSGVRLRKKFVNELQAGLGLLALPKVNNQKNFKQVSLKRR